MLSYQHIYHAGNGADIQKHLWLICVLDYLLKKDKPLCWIDTHAGRGRYDLSSPEAQKLGEYRTALLPVLQYLHTQNNLPHLLARYQTLLAPYMQNGTPSAYPGSALLTARILRPSDRLLAFDLHKGEFPHLRQTLSTFENTTAKHSDGIKALLANIPPPERRGGCLIDPSYEIKTEYDTVFQTVQKALKKWASGIYMIWVPILAAKHHEKLIENCQALAQQTGTELAIDEWRWREKDTSGKGMEGSLMLIFNPPYTCTETMAEVKACLLPLLKNN